MNDQESNTPYWILLVVFLTVIMIGTVVNSANRNNKMINKINK